MTSKTKNKVLIATSGGLGDVLMEIPLIRRLKNRGLKIIIIGSRNNPGFQILQSQKEVDGAIALDPDATPLVQGAKVSFKERAVFRHFKYCVVPVFSLDRPTFWTLFAAKKLKLIKDIRVQFAEKPSWFAKQLANQPVAFDGRLHDVANHMELIGETKPVLEAEMQRAPVTVAKDNTWIFQAGAGRGTTYKILAPQKMAAIINLWHQSYPHLTPVLVGDKSEKAFADEIASFLKMPFQNLAGKTSVKDLMTVIEKAHGLTCYDSGVMHLAHYMARPVFCIFGPTAPERNGPYASRTAELYRQQFSRCLNPCHLPAVGECPLDFACLKEAKEADIAGRLIEFTKKQLD